MSDRGLPIVDAAQACPFVAFEDDRDERATSPDHRHRCYAETRPAPRALAHQEAYCLSSNFPVCPTFQDWARREAAAARAGAGGGEPFRNDEPVPRNPPRDWSAPPPWSVGAAAGAGAVPGMFDAEDDDGEGEADTPGFLSSRSAAAGAGLAGSAADRLAGGRGPGDEARYGPTDQPEQRPPARLDALGDDDDRVDERAGDRYEEDFEEDPYDPGPRGRPRSARASGGIGFGRDRRPRVGATRRARGWDDAGPSWERPRHNEPYPVLKSGRLPRVSRLGWMAIALVVAAVALFFLPQLLGLGGSPATGDRTTPRPGSTGPAASLGPTPVPVPTPQVYIVKSGDTMSSIAKQFGVTLDDLIAANREAHPNPDTLQIGDEIIIPTASPGGTARPSPSA